MLNGRKRWVDRELRHSEGYSCASFDRDYCPKGMNFLENSGFACLVVIWNPQVKVNPVQASA